MNLLVSARRFLFESSTGWINRMIAADERGAAAADARSLRRGRAAEAPASKHTFTAGDGPRSAND